MKKIILLALALFSFMQVQASDNMVMCPMDAKQCSDGTWVGRSGPSCEFVCPSETKKMDPSWDLNQDGLNDCEQDGSCDDSIDYTLPKPKACTMQYEPICAEVQVQCIKAPCFPIQETFSNKCEMANNSLAKFLHEGACKDDTIDEDNEVMMCPMIYMPVCGNDWKTYGNACSAGKIWVKYPGICVSEKYEISVSNAWKQAAIKHFSKASSLIITQTLEKVVKNAERLAWKESFDSQRWAIFNYLWYLAKDMLHKNIYEKYIKENISTLSPVVPVLWGKWYVTHITWLDTHTATVEYEDGHIVENMKINISLKDGKLQVSDLEKRLEISGKFDNKDIVVKLKVPTSWEGKYSYKFINPGVLQFNFTSNGEWENMLFNINIHTDTDWKKEEENWLLNLNKLFTLWGYVVSYSNVLDMPFIKDENISRYSSMLGDVNEVVKSVDLMMK